MGCARWWVDWPAHLPTTKRCLRRSGGRDAYRRGEPVDELIHRVEVPSVGAEEIMAVGKVAVGDHWPDLTVVFDVDERVAATRLNPLLDRMELKGVQFHRRVRQGYLDQARRGDLGKYLVIDASVDEDTVFENLLLGIEASVRR
jgi:thymidylate kinase